MTQEAFTPTPLVLIAGTGPYTIMHGYDAGALVVAAVSATARTVLAEADYTVTPTSSNVEGSLTLSAGAATAYDGQQLEITRDTQVEQGFAGQTSRERGLEAQLDWIVRGQQDARRSVSSSLRTSARPLNFLPEGLAGRALAFDENEQPVAGPLVDDIPQAQAAATAAIAAAAAAQADADSAAASAVEAAASAQSLNAENLLTKDGNLDGLTDPAIARTNLELGTAATKNVAQLSAQLFAKANTAIVAFTKTGAGTAETATEIYAEVNGTLLTVASGTSITMPSLTAGTDYAIWLATDGTLSATTSFTVPPSAGARHIGGFHYAPGGNAAAMAGGDTTPQINEYSFWDRKFRPACPDPRGMTLVAGGFWCDIYLLGVDHLINGTSKYNVPIADGSSPPRRPTLFGGDGTATYSTLTWWEAAEVMASHGKRLLSYADFAAAAYGTTENTSAGTDPGSTILRQAYTSKWGLMLATGNMWVWGDEFGGGAAAAAWANINGGRGQVYQIENALVLGGSWGNAAFSGSRASSWANSPSGSGGNIGARGRCEHLSLV